MYKTRAAPTPQPADPSEFQSSFGDVDDPNAVAAEEARIAAARTAVIAARQQATEAESGGTLRRAQPAGEVDGVEAYRLPSENLSPRGRGDRKEPSQKDVARSTENPNFKSSR